MQYTNKTSILVVLAVLVALLTQGCASTSNTRTARIGPTSDADQNGQFEEFHSKRRSLESEARYAVDRQWHRIAYYKYRDIESLLSAWVDVLASVREQEAGLQMRIKISRQIDRVNGDLSDVRKMIGLLRLSGHGQG